MRKLMLSGLVLTLTLVTACAEQPQIPVAEPPDELFSSQSLIELFDADTCSNAPQEFWTFVSCQEKSSNSMDAFFFYRPDAVDLSEAAEAFNTRFFNGSLDNSASCGGDQFSDRTEKLFDFRIIVGKDYWAEVNGSPSIEGLEKFLGRAEEIADVLGGVIYTGPVFCGEQPNPFVPQ